MYTLLARDHRTVGRSQRTAELDALAEGA